ncbi:hypothetical protein QBC34DRAFT_472960, partial [Podospora aff. communis PSN243]
MKPLSFELATPEYLKDKLFLFDPERATIQYIEHLLIRSGGACIKTQGGLCLPTECWLSIVRCLSDEAARPGRQFHFVKASLVPSPSSGLSTSAQKMLRCVRHEFERKNNDETKIAGRLWNAPSILDFEDFLQNATPKKISEFNAHRDLLNMDEGQRLCEALPTPVIQIPMLRELSGRGATRYIPLRKGPGRVRFGALYCELEVPDIIARTEGGFCSLCNCDRIVEASTMMQSAYLGMFSRTSDFSIPEDVPITCPLCVGLYYFQHEIAYLAGLA